MTGAGDALDGTRRRALVVGIGSTDRGDDAVGPLVARGIAARGLLGVTVVEHEDPTALLDLWEGHNLVVVADAVHSNDPPGTVHLREAGAGAPPLSTLQTLGAAVAGSHGFGAAAAVELARALGRLPHRLVLVGVEAGRFDHGAGLSGPVADAVPEAVERAVTAIEGPPGS